MDIEETKNKETGNMRKKDIPVVIWADTEISPIGLRSKLAREVGGVPVFRRTLERVTRSKKVSCIIIFCKPEQKKQIENLTEGFDVDIRESNFILPGWWPGLQAARKWALSCWRGGMLGTCAFDEDILAHVLSPIAEALDVDALMIIPAHACLIDPDIIDRQIERYVENEEEWKFNFTQAPPGLSGLILHIDVINQLRTKSKFVGQAVSYHPSSARPDIIGKPCNTPIDISVIKTPVRFVCDTERSLELIDALADKIDLRVASAEEITNMTKNELIGLVNKYPRDIELEVYRGWPWPKGLREHPKGETGSKDVSEQLERIADIAKKVDDLTVFLGGLGEPMSNPEIGDIVNQLREAGVWGIGLQTSCLYDADIVEKLAGLDIDVANILIDVPNAQLYAEIMGIDAYPMIIENIKLLINKVYDMHKAIPLIIPEMIKTQQTLELMDEFYDSWFKSVGWAVIKKI